MKEIDPKRKKFLLSLLLIDLSYLWGDVARLDLTSCPMSTHVVFVGSNTMRVASLPLITTEEDAGAAEAAAAGAAAPAENQSELVTSTSGGQSEREREEDLAGYVD